MVALYMIIPHLLFVLSSILIYESMIILSYDNGSIIYDYTPPIVRIIIYFYYMRV